MGQGTAGWKVAWCAAVLAAALGRGPAAERLVLSLNPDWRFIRADPNGAEQPGFDDRQWSGVSLPHTYNDADTFDDWSIEGHRGEQDQWGGRTWYRKTFALPASAQGRKVYIEFEAVRQVAEVYLNGRLLGVHKSGFSPFGLDLTPHLNPGGANVLAVMCDNRFQKDPLAGEWPGASQRAANPVGAADRGQSGGTRGASLAEMTEGFNRMIPDSLADLQADQIPWNNPHWHPAHGGIYRNVRLHIVDPLHISLPLTSFLDTVGPYAYTQDLSGESVTVGIEAPVQNGRSTRQRIEVTAEVRDREDRPVLSATAKGDLEPGARETYKMAGRLRDPRPWEPGHPYMYRVVLQLRAGGRTVDTCEVPLGIRSARWTVDQGLWINGRHLKLRGWGQKPTDEWPGIGAAQPDWMHFYALRLMKEAGGNFVRWGHTAGGPAQIEAADRLGLLVDQPGVDGEGDTRGAAWQLRAATFRDVLVYFRNHPSILVWEGGNQKVSHEHAAELRGIFEEVDPHGGRVYAHRRPDKVVAEFMDVQIGTEGGSDIGAGTMPLFEGEYNREEAPRRVWDDATPRRVGGDPCSPLVFGYVEGRGSYRLTSEQFAANQVAQFVGKLHAPHHSGGANWIFTDSTSGGRVSSEVCRASGEVDAVRLPKEAYYVCRVMFRDEPQVHILGHWNYAPGTTKAVVVASNAEQVELRVNGKPVGRRGPDESQGLSLRYLFTFPDVTWAAGEVKAVAYKGGQVVAEQVKATAGGPVALRLTPITGPGGLLADGSDYVLIDVEAVDSEGRRCPTFEQRVDFGTQGPGVWRGGYNSGLLDSVNNPWLNLECGVNRVAVRSTREAGLIRVTARCRGLQDGGLTVRSSPVAAPDGLLASLPVMPMPDLPATPAAASPDRWLGPSVRPAPPHARYVTSFSYSGPTTTVHVESDARDGKKVYTDSDLVFAGLPAGLIGADWVQAAGADGLYHAVDLMQIGVQAGTVVFVAHDDRAPRPAWLTRQFQPSGLSLTIDGGSMTLFRRSADRDEGLTLGPNTEGPGPTACAMYVVLVNAAGAP
ncbi:MAG: DUF4982 domain-containing protein [Phycisphaerae bacterium]|nr:DUF4982 domain-containing protein [Phycisphaerae bacterium]